MNEYVLYLKDQEKVLLELGDGVEMTDAARAHLRQAYGPPIGGFKVPAGTDGPTIASIIFESFETDTPPTVVQAKRAEAQPNRTPREAFKCLQCGKRFKRVPKPGRKPKRCPQCALLHRRDRIRGAARKRRAKEKGHEAKAAARQPAVPDGNEAPAAPQPGVDLPPPEAKPHVLLFGGEPSRYHHPKDSPVRVTVLHGKGQKPLREACAGIKAHKYKAVVVVTKFCSHDGRVHVKAACKSANVPYGATMASEGYGQARVTAETMAKEEK